MLIVCLSISPADRNWAISGAAFCRPPKDFAMIFRPLCLPIWPGGLLDSRDSAIRLFFGIPVSSEHFSVVLSQ